MNRRSRKSAGVLIAGLVLVAAMLGGLAWYSQFGGWRGPSIVPGGGRNAMFADPQAPPTKMRTIDFPDDASLGALFFRPWGSANNWQTAGQAQGKFRIPAGMEVRLDFVTGQSSRRVVTQRLVRVGKVDEFGDRVVIEGAQPLALSNLPLSTRTIKPDSTYQVRVQSARSSQILRVRSDSQGRLVVPPGATEILQSRNVTVLVRAGPTSNPGASPFKPLKVDSIQTLNLSAMVMTDAEFQAASKLKGLWRLVLAGTQISDLAMFTVRELESLRLLDLTDTKITDRGITRLRGLDKLEFLYLSNTNVTDASVPYIGSFKTLKVLRLTGTKISREAKEELSRNLPNCSIEWTDPVRIDGPGARFLDRG